MTSKLTTGLCAAALLSLTAVAAQADSQKTLIIENFVGTINWTNGSGDISITKERNEEGTRIYKGNEFIIDGEIENVKGAKCKGYYGSYDISLFGKKESNKGKFGGYEDLEDYPIFDVSVPKDTKLIIRNSIVFTEGNPDFSSADLSLNHCGKINMGDVAGKVYLEGRGSADLNMGDAEEFRSEMRGSGDIEAGTIGFLRSEGRGSGDIQVAQATNIDLEMSGSGDVEVDDVTGSAIIEASGSGDFDFGKIGGSLDFQGSGSGDLSVDGLGDNGNSRVSLERSGSGDVSIDDGDISELYVRASGSSSIDIDAVVQNAVLKASGSSDIFVDTVLGSLEKSTSGSSDIDISDRR